MRIDGSSAAVLTGVLASTRSAVSNGPTISASSAGSVISDIPSALAALATSLGVSSGSLNSLISAGGQSTVTAGGVARLAGLPMVADGTPNFDAIVAAGGTVKGAIPPDGETKITNVDGDRQTTYVATEVTMPGGQPVYVKSMNMRTPGGDQSGNLAYVRNALHYFQKLPNSWQEAQKRLGDGENFFDAATLVSSVDLHL